MKSNIKEQIKKYLDQGSSDAYIEAKLYMSYRHLGIKTISDYIEEVKNAKDIPFVVGKYYRHDQIPKESNDELDVNEHGDNYLGMSAKHIRYHKTEIDVWFIWESYSNQAIYKCVYKN